MCITLSAGKIVSQQNSLMIAHMAGEVYTQYSKLLEFIYEKMYIYQQQNAALKVSKVWNAELKLLDS